MLQFVEPLLQIFIALNCTYSSQSNFDCVRNVIYCGRIENCTVGLERKQVIVNAELETAIVCAFRFIFWKYGINKIKIARSSFMQTSIITDYILDIRLWSLSQSAPSLSDVSYPWFLSPVSNTSCIKCLGTARVISLNYLFTYSQMMI